MIGGHKVIALCMSRIHDMENSRFIAELNRRLSGASCSLFIYNINTDLYWDENHLSAETAVFDLIPILYLLNDDLFVQKKGKIDVILDGEDTQGQTLFKEGEGDHIVLIDADREGCMKVFFDAIDQLDERYI